MPFMVLSAGTRNHFALDLGLDRENPAAGLDALTDGVELHIDLGSIDGRTFVNNASFGAYAAVVQSPAYRDDKIRTTLDMLPDLLTERDAAVLRVAGGGRAAGGTPGRAGEQQPVRLGGRDRPGRTASPPRRRESSGCSPSRCSARRTRSRLRPGPHVREPSGA